jgi:hypothetical protein
VAFAPPPGTDPLIDSPAEVLLVRAGQVRRDVVGLCTLNQVDP